MKSSSIKSNYFFNLLYKIVTIITPLITAPYIARVFGATGVGEYGYVYSVAQYFYSFAMLGISDYGSRSIAKVRGDKDKLNTTFSEILIMQVCTALIACIAYYFYALQLANNRLLALLQGMQIVSVFFDISWLFFGLEQFKLISIRNICIKLGSVICILLFVRSLDDIWKYTGIIAGSTIISQLIVLPSAYKNVSFIKPKSREILKHVKPNIILFLPVIAANVLHYFDKVMLGNMSTVEEIGFYDSAEKIIQIPNSMITALGGVVLPAISNIVQSRNNVRLKQIRNNTFVFVSLSVCALAFGISAVAKEFVPIFYGDGFDEVVRLLYILTPAMAFISFANIIKSQYLLPFSRDGVFATCLIIGIVINVLLNSLLIPQFGSAGASIATTISEASILVSELIWIRKEISISEHVKTAFPFVIFGAVMFIAVNVISTNNVLFTLIIKTIIGAVLYLVLSIIWCSKHQEEFLSTIVKRKPRE